MLVRSLQRWSFIQHLKGIQEKKCAQALASRLEGPAFDIYLQLSTEERKDIKKVTEELLKEFERGKHNREEAISELSNVEEKTVSLYNIFHIRSWN